MIHFLYLLGFSVFVAVVFAAISDGEPKKKILYGLKVFAQFVVVSLVLSWLLYFIPF